MILRIAIWRSNSYVWLETLVFLEKNLRVKNKGKNKARIAVPQKIRKKYLGQSFLKY